VAFFVFVNIGLFYRSGGVLVCILDKSMFFYAEHPCCRKLNAKLNPKFQTINRIFVGIYQPEHLCCRKQFQRYS
jgi:hypothetical protein